MINGDAMVFGIRHIKCIARPPRHIMRLGQLARADLTHHLKGIGVQYGDPVMAQVGHVKQFFVARQHDVVGIGKRGGAGRNETRFKCVRHGRPQHGQTQRDDPQRFHGFPSFITRGSRPWRGAGTAATASP